MSGTGKWIRCPGKVQTNVLLASAVPLAARQGHFDHAGSEGNPQCLTLAVYLHADDALVLHTVDTAP